MDNRISKIYNVVAHNSKVNCMKISPKSGNIMITGGDDRKIKLWIIGKLKSLASLEGHSTPVECVTIDWTEEIVVAGSSSGTIKLWDLELEKVIRTLTGHQSNTTCVEFHPFGDFFASGSSDKTAKIWDVRRKGYIQTYMGHQKPISCLSISPDGRWIATGSEDSSVKIWDMTAGKLIKSYNDHEGPITSIVFNPSEFTMASASYDGTIKYYDLQTFDMIDTTLSQDSIPNLIRFHPTEDITFGVYNDSLQTYSWEPTICHDRININWTNVKDMIVSEDKILCGSTDQNIISIWAENIENIKPFLQSDYNINYSIDSRSISNNKNITSPSYDNNTQVNKQPIVNEVMGFNIPKTPSSSSVSKPKSNSNITPSSNFLNNSNKNIVSNIGISKLSLNNNINDNLYENNSNNPVISNSHNNVIVNKSFSSTYNPSLTSNNNNFNQLPSSKYMFISSSGNTIQNIDAAKFLTNSSNQELPLNPLQAGITTIENEMDIIDSLKLRNNVMETILTKRLNNIKYVHQAWDDTNVKASIELLIQLHDPAITVDILKLLKFKLNMINLEICTMLLPILKELLFEIYEDYIVTSCSIIKYLAKTFSDLIISNLKTNINFPSTGIDISREERLQRCKIAYQEFSEINMCLQDLKNSGGLININIDVKEREKVDI
ncbi:WD40 repeat-like protein [Piromyces finnis]|uniref:Katanin p80 WD40 repeat-containing subunit B1 homolog n=1 Tax=Piromyces finnis TaxID=1754191 RepID=A0A1Y1UYI3_9FUNG|nr:WD40 repeat-like protein [Piromyces finnis]|eukprot:ORX42869.1 WD40 repeat-like protein [Piromyces finnis]